MEWDPAERSAKANYDFLCSVVAPRPIAWVTTVDEAGLVNAAPFSWFNAVCADPMTVMLAISDRRAGEPKDTVRNLRATGELVVNAAPAKMGREMVLSSGDYPHDVSEVEALGLATRPSLRVRPPRLAGSPAHLECRLDRIIELGQPGRAHTNLVLANVVHCAIDDAATGADGGLDHAKAPLLARMGGTTYTDTQAHFDIPRPRPDELPGLGAR